MKNTYEVRGDVTAIIINSPKYGRFETLISTAKIERVMEFAGSWYVTYQKQIGTFYVKGDIYINSKKNEKVFLHRWIKRVDKKLLVDHFDNDTLNNTDENLREATVAENGQNRKGAQRNSKSGIRGVMWVERVGKWNATIKLNQKRIDLGFYEDVSEAERVAKEARARLMPYSSEASA